MMESFNSMDEPASLHGDRSLSSPTTNGATSRIQSETRTLQESADLFDGDSVDHARIEASVREMLLGIGEDPDREGLVKTPDRVARAYDELMAGYRTDPVALINDAVFDVEYDEMVLVRDIEYYSLCEHHMLPFLGRAHVAYIPRHKVVGLSKIPRIVDMFARRLQVQERMTTQIATFIQDALDPQGVAVVCEGVHMCSMIRGVKKSGSKMVTSHLLGEFKTNPATRAEFMNHIDRGNTTLMSF